MDSIADCTYYYPNLQDCGVVFKEFSISFPNHWFILIHQIWTEEFFPIAVFEGEER